MKTTRLPKIFPALLALFFLCLGLPLAMAADAASLKVHVLDVGQGDAILVSSPAGRNVLIDAGTPESTQSLLARLDALVRGPLDLIVMTHPHADHIGGMAEVLRKKGTKLFLDPGFDHASKMYAGVVTALEELAIPVKRGQAGRKIDLGGGAVMELLAPSQPFHKGTRSDANANSIVAHLRFGQTAFYLAADSEHETEQRVLEEIVKGKGQSIRSNVYKVAHHGSRHASSDELLAEIQPEIAVISAGKNNRYGHPTPEAMARCSKAGAKIYRTDLHGEVVLTSDGKKVTVKTDREGGDEEAIATAQVARSARDASVEPAKAAASAAVPEGGFIASRKSKSFHAATCRNGQKIVPQNRVHLATLEEARASGKKPARCCLKDDVLTSAAAAPAMDRPATPQSDAQDSDVSLDAPDSAAAYEPIAAAPSEGGYASSKRSKKFHKASCGSAAKIKPANKITFATREEAVASGREPAKDCKP
ncbi:MAG: MBL fold metallo-hydrolase [Myxococcaceae bacterium]|nr:MBL fold metallo-hydrolase [Myxococcaceae bacterium]